MWKEEMIQRMGWFSLMPAGSFAKPNVPINRKRGRGAGNEPRSGGLDLFVRHL